MSLRRFPRRTPAFLAANRANAQKSTGPRTALGKQRSAANALRTGKRASPAFWPRVLSHSELAEFHALRDAIERAVSADGKNQNVAGKAARLVWSVRRYAERFLRTLPPDARRQIANRLIPVPRFWHSAIPGPGWKVTVTVFARRGRRRRCDMSAIPTVGSTRMSEAVGGAFDVGAALVAAPTSGFRMAPMARPIVGTKLRSQGRRRPRRANTVTVTFQAGPGMALRQRRGTATWRFAICRRASGGRVRRKRSAYRRTDQTSRAALPATFWFVPSADTARSITSRKA